jgi:phosphate acetyltransferase/phosphate butyryltransferase
MSRCGDMVTGAAAAPLAGDARPNALPPEVHGEGRGARYQQLIHLTKGLAPLHTAVVHPVDRTRS